MLLRMTYVLSTLKITEMHRRKLLESIRWRCEKAAWWRCLERVPPLRPCPHHREELSLEITFPSDYTWLLSRAIIYSAYPLFKKWISTSAETLKKLDMRDKRLRRTFPQSWTQSSPRLSSSLASSMEIHTILLKPADTLMSVLRQMRLLARTAPTGRVP